MTQLTLVISNPNYSSWSLRAWFALKSAGIPFIERRIPFMPDATRRERILRHSPTGKVPALWDGDLCVWESLAIGEYLAEKFPDKNLWPADPAARAVARSVSAEMHAGFAALRQHMTMNCRRQRPGVGREPGVAEDIARVTAIWNQCRTQYGQGGLFLFGRLSFADAMYAPVVTRFKTYEVAVDAVSADYMKAMLALPAMQEWYALARAEPETIPQYE